MGSWWPRVGAALTIVGLALVGVGSAWAPRLADPGPVIDARVDAEPTAPAFVPSWVQNHRLTELWSGPAGSPGVRSFGTTSTRFCVFLVVRPQDNARLYVLNPYTGNYLWIDAEAVGPVTAAERRAEPKPADQTCADALYVSGGLRR